MVATLNTGVMSTPTLLGLDPDEVLNKTTVKEAEAMKNGDGATEDLAHVSHDQSSLGEDDINVTFTTYDSIFDLLIDERSDQHIRTLTSNAWVRVDTDRYVLTGKDGWMTLDKSGTESEGLFVVQYVQTFADENTGKRVHTRPRVVARAPDLEQAVHAADTFATVHFNEVVISIWQPWRKAPATPAQLKLLNTKRPREGKIRQGDLTKGQANDMITRLKFGTKGRYETEQKKLKKEHEQRVKLEELRKRENVKVGPLT
jgi:ATP-dependent helicase IRC3